MAPTGAWYSIWATECDDYDSQDLLLDCLLPTGIIVQLQCVSKNAKLVDIKTSLWEEARNYPLYSLLKKKTDYVFVCINEMAVKVELDDETKRLSDVRPFQPMLKLVEKTNLATGARAEKLIQAQISVLLGKRVDELASIESNEVVDFRKHMHEMCERTARARDSQDWLERAMCFYPPDIATDPSLPPHLVQVLDKNRMILVTVFIEYMQVSYTLQVGIEQSCPDDVVKMALEKCQSRSAIAIDSYENYVLRVSGRDEYFLGTYPLSQFRYVRRAMSNSEKLELIIVTKNKVLEEMKPALKPRVPRPPDKNSRDSLSPRDSDVVMRNKGNCLYDLTELFSITLISVSNVNVVDFSLVNVRACLYHGRENLCNRINTPEKRILGGGTIEWHERMNFELTLCDIPRMMRLCFMLYTTGDRRTRPTGKAGRLPTGGKTMRSDGRKEIIPLAWVNIPVFDYKGTLRSGEHKLYMWPITDEDILTEELLNPIGTVESNSQILEAACLTINFHKYNLKGPIYYPPFDKVLEVAAKNSGLTESQQDGGGNFASLALDPSKVTKEHLRVLQQMIERDPMHDHHEQEKEMIWQLRHECREHFPQSLPKLLTCVHWANRIDVAIMQSLLQIWQPLSPNEALELLDYQYADKSVRAFAVQCLKVMSDSELFQYLLQFVQALKYESYLECELIEFLLQRAINNQKIGHHLFWLLRSEMHIPSVSVRFGLILEAYCRGNVEHLGPLSKQVEAIRCLGKLADIVKKLPLAKDKRDDEMVKVLKNPSFVDALSSLPSPLDSCQRLKQPCYEKCKSMDSKMKPLWLVWKNAELAAGTKEFESFMMFKKGDDLRQDMLSLQMLRIMDNLWQAEGLDLRLSAYGCLSTGLDEGLIEIVTPASTIAKIQLENPGISKVQSAFNKLCIYQWLQKHNSSKQSLDKAIEQFMLSCAGYCVATYVLGVGDRHSDNIMLRTNGQMFHIDFGHILGHFKSKLGVKRERVPFVLTSDFVYVIKRGKEQDDKNFARFRNLCVDAYQILRRNCNFLITLFLMMMNTGLPEVSCLQDVEYLRKTLVPHYSDEEANEFFKQKFQEALHYGWKASANNVFHLFRVG